MPNDQRCPCDKVRSTLGTSDTHTTMEGEDEKNMISKSNGEKKLSVIENPLRIEKDKNTDKSEPSGDEGDSEDEPSGDEGDSEDVPIMPEVTYCKYVGILGTLLLLFALLISGIMVLLFYLYSYYFKNLEREMVWIFLVLGIIYAISPLVLLRSWKRTAEAYLYGTFVSGIPTIKLQSNKRQNPIMKVYKLFTINGKYFLFKLYLFEFIESIVQINNMFTIYSCSLESVSVAGICLVFTVDGFLRGWFLSQVHSASRRYKQIISDLVLDFFCIAMPLIVMYFVYGVPIAMSEMIAILAWPSFCLLSKTRSIFREILRMNVIRSAAAEHQSFKLESRRNLKLQEEVFPKSVRRALSVYNVLNGVFFLCYGIIQMQAVYTPPVCTSLHPNDRPDDVKALYDGCIVKVPTCGSTFKPSCNCVVLKLDHHNFTRLPGMFTEMNALKKIQIKDGPLRTLPENIGTKLYRISEVNVDFNRLQALPESMSKANELITLYASFNEISEVPLLLWQSKSIIQLDLSSNKLNMIPDDVQMVQLYVLKMTNNSVALLPPQLFTHTSLVVLEMDGNNISSLPQEIELRKGFRVLYLARNKLADSSFPPSMRYLKNLEVLDLRNNELTAIPYVAAASASSLVSLTVSGNPMCNKTKSDFEDNGIKCMREDNAMFEACPEEIRTLLMVSDDRVLNGCQKQCSEYCLEYIRKWPNEEYCDYSCNSKECNFDDGDCA
eukprot:g2756.t1